MKTKDFTGCVLAGGKSSRMKTDKAFIEIGGKTFLQKASDALAPNVGKLRLVFNQSQTRFIEKLPANSDYIFDVYENRGALGGIHAALENCRTEFALILAVDMPFVTSDAIRNLCGIAKDSKDFSAIVPRQSDGRLQPLCAAYRAENCLPKIEEILRKDVSASVRDFLQNIEVKIIDQKILSEDESLFDNINYPAEFEKAKREI